MTSPLAIVLLSGGIDSAVALWWALAGGYAVRALAFDYHLRAASEARAARALAARADVPLESVALPFLREGLDAAHPLAQLGIGVTRGYVPGRNLVFYGVAAARAEALGARAIVGGHISTDSEGFPDAAPAYFRALEDLLRLGALAGERTAIELLMPLAGLSKAEVLQRALTLGVPLEATFSCYGSGPAHCGKCPSCEERQEAFAAIGYRDPVLSC